MTHHIATTNLWPSKWPEPPERMSFSTLAAIESCPLRWALSRADYEGTWSGPGYPSKVNSASIVGQVIHRVIETVCIRSQSLAGATFAARILAVVRDAGGFTKLIDQTLTAVLNQYEDNPRAARLLEQYRSGRRELPPTVRPRIQSLLRDIAGNVSSGPSPSIESRTSAKQSGPALSSGLYSEIKLSIEEHGWHGTVDLISIDVDGATLEDIKTGAVKDADTEQLITYAWLWWRDDSRNPSRTLPDRLTIRYTDGPVNIPVPNEQELLKFEQRLLARTLAVRTNIANGEFVPRPDVQHCEHCDVRQLCETYWQDIASREQFVSEKSCDVEVRFVNAVGTDAWEVTTTKSSALPPGTYHLRGRPPKSAVPTGATLRLLDVTLIGGSDDAVNNEIPILQLRAHSEIFVCPDIQNRADE